MAKARRRSAVEVGNTCEIFAGSLQLTQALPDTAAVLTEAGAMLQRTERQQLLDAMMDTECSLHVLYEELEELVDAVIAHIENKAKKKEKPDV